MKSVLQTSKFPVFFVGSRTCASILELLCVFSGVHLWSSAFYSFKLKKEMMGLRVFNNSQFVFRRKHFHGTSHLNGIYGHLYGLPLLNIEIIHLIVTLFSKYCSEADFAFSFLFACVK